MQSLWDLLKKKEEAKTLRLKPTTAYYKLLYFILKVELKAKLVFFDRYRECGVQRELVA